MGLPTHGAEVEPNKVSHPTWQTEAESKQSGPPYMIKMTSYCVCFVWGGLVVQAAITAAASAQAAPAAQAAKAAAGAEPQCQQLQIIRLTRQKDGFSSIASFFIFL